MAERAKTSTSRKSADKKTSSRRWRFFLAVAFIVLIFSTFGASFWLLSRFLFSHNDHLKLKHVVVSSSGWWNGRTAKISKFLGIAPGRNLFQLDLVKLRNKLETHPSIKKVSIARILPDTLAFKIVERIPRAVLFDSKSKWVVDSSGMVMDRKACVEIGKDLTVILGIDRRPDMKAGTIIKKLKPAMEMIMQCKTEYTDLKVATINVRLPSKISAIVYYKDYNRSYKVYMPTKNVGDSLLKLTRCIAKAKRLGDPRTSINLNYKDQAVLR